MNTVERIKSICKERKIAISKLEQDLNFGNAYISQLKKGTIPDDRLKAVSDYLDLSMEYLVTGQEKIDHFTGEEKVLVEEFRCLNDTGRKQALEYIRAMKGIHPVEVPEQKII